MKFFTKKEGTVVLFILLIISAFSYGNFKVAIRRSRDAQRRADLADVVNALESYHRDFGKFPFASEDGRIKACKPNNFDNLIISLEEDKDFMFTDYLQELVPCDWGEDTLRDLADLSYPAYLNKLPQDPKTEDGYSYFFLSNGDIIQTFAYLEGAEEEIGFDAGIVARNLKCGNNICNFGKSIGKTPLDKSIQEYENELLRENK